MVTFAAAPGASDVGAPAMLNNELEALKSENETSADPRFLTENVDIYIAIKLEDMVDMITNI